MADVELEHMAFLACVSPEPLAGEHGNRVARLVATLGRRLTVPERLRLLGTVVAFVEEGRASSQAVLPFVLLDPSEVVVAVASREFALLHPSPPRDPLQGVHRLCAELEAHRAAAGRRAAAHVGLVTLGDARVEPWVLGRSNLLMGSAGLRSLACLQGVLPTTLMVEFLLDALEHAPAPEVATALADILADLPRAAPGGVVMEIERTFPSTAAPAGCELRVVGRVSFHELLERVRPRLATVALLAEVEGGGALQEVGRGQTASAAWAHVVAAVERLMDAWASVRAAEGGAAAA
jgi:hypothetical protein